MRNRVGAITTAYQPEFRTSATQKGSEVICIDENTAFHSQSHHLGRCAGSIEITSECRITIHLMAEMIQSIQQRLRGRIHYRKPSETSTVSSHRPVTEPLGSQEVSAASCSAKRGTTMGRSGSAMTKRGCSADQHRSRVQGSAPQPSPERLRFPVGCFGPRAAIVPLIRCRRPTAAG